MLMILLLFLQKQNLQTGALSGSAKPGQTIFYQSTALSTSTVSINSFNPMVVAEDALAASRVCQIWLA
jgi:hypothetical protein